jgi:hypothetical protein
MITQISKGKTYQYYRIHYYKKIHLTAIHKGKKKSLITIHDYDITLDDLKTQLIHVQTLENIKQYTKEKKERMKRIEEARVKSGGHSKQDLIYYLKFGIRLYEKPFDPLIDELYENTIKEKDLKNTLVLLRTVYLI